MLFLHSSLLFNQIHNGSLAGPTIVGMINREVDELVDNAEEATLVLLVARLQQWLQSEAAAAYSHRSPKEMGELKQKLAAASARCGMATLT